MKPIAKSVAVQPDSRASGFGPGAFAIRSLGGAFGAEILGLDLASPLTHEAAQRIQDAFLSHHLVVVRDQKLTRSQMGAFAALFGELEGNIVRNADGSTLEAIHEISNLDARGLPAENSYIKSNYHWHTDKAYLPVPALLTMLHAIELPQSGGDTEFADMTSAYAALSDEDRQRIADLRVVHSFEFMRASTGDRPLTDAERAAIRQPSTAVYGQYERTVDRESAYEKLTQRVGDNASPAPTGGTKPAGPTTAEAKPAGGGGFLDSLGDLLGGSTGPRGGRREGALEAAARSAARAIGSQVGREIVRGVLGSLLGGRKR